MSALEIIRANLAEWAAIRRDLHAHPELAFEERRTAGLVADLLAQWGIEVHRGIGGTGVVGRLRKGTGPQTVGLRADMDALPMQEANTFAHRSQTPNQMHACGHDGHTTMLLAAAHYLATRGVFDGTLHFIFQPAEETLTGAMAMIRDGLLTRFPCDRVFAIHSRPGVPVGNFSIRSGAMMAGGASFDITVMGRGSHGARPEGGVDPILAACHISIALQSIVSRNVSPFESAVVSVTRISGGDAYNTIPAKATIAGTARAFSDDVMALIEQRLNAIATGVAGGLGATVEVAFRRLVPPLVNEKASSGLMAEAAVELVGTANVNTNAPSLMASEDFSFVLQQCPGAYMNVGNGNIASSAALHNADYDFNDEATPYGAALLVRVAERTLRHSS